MRARGALAVAAFAVTTAVLILFGQRSQTAVALPTFAQAYGIDCVGPDPPEDGASDRRARVGEQSKHR